LSALDTGRLYLPRNIPCIHFWKRVSQPQGQSAAERIMSMKNPNDTARNRTLNLPVCSAVPQPTNWTTACPSLQLFCFTMKQQPPVGHGLLIIEESRSHSDTPHSGGLLWTRDHPIAEIYLITHNTHNRQTSMPSAGFEPTIPASGQPQTYVLDRAATRKSKAIPVQAWRGSEGSKSLRLPDFMTIGTWCGKVVSPTHRPPLLPRKYSWYSFLLEAESTPRP
jgi:hypothetical protein